MDEKIISLIWLAFWPILIYVVFRVSLFVLKRKNYLTEEEESES
jgi:hypothetical protein